MIKYCNINFPQDGRPMWLSMDRQHVDQWSMILQLQNLIYQRVDLQQSDEWLFLGDKFFQLKNPDTQQIVATAISKARHVVINDLVHAVEGQHNWLWERLPAWMPQRDYIFVTNSQTTFLSRSWLSIYHYNFLFNRTKAYYAGFPFVGSPWYFAGSQNYRAPAVIDNSEQKTKVFISPCRLYIDQQRTCFRKQLFDLMSQYDTLGYRSGPGRVPNRELDKSATGLYLLSTVDDPLLNFNKLGWKYDPTTKKATVDMQALDTWQGSEWYGYNPVHNYYYDDTFISIYGETIEYGKVVVITEKTYDPLIKGHFILPFSTSGFLTYVRALGFQLPDFIDYSYDQIEDDSTRFECYVAEVKRLISIPIRRWGVLLKQHLDMLRHNQKLFYIIDYHKLQMFR